MKNFNEHYKDEASRNPFPNHAGSMCGGLDEGHEEMEDTLDVEFQNKYEKMKWNTHGFDQSGMR